MTSHVALLRGINVGGNNIIRMSELVDSFERLGFSSVRTYIASGNVLFDAKPNDAKDPRKLERKIEAALTKAHAYDATVVLRTRAEMEKIVTGMPPAWRRIEADTRYYVLFLRHEIDSKGILKRIGAKPDLELLSYRPGVLYWSAHRKDLGRTAMSRLPSHAIYPYVTIRNLNTTKKIHELFEAVG